MFIGRTAARQTRQCNLQGHERVLGPPPCPFHELLYQLRFEFAERESAACALSHNSLVVAAKDQEHSWFDLDIPYRRSVWLREEIDACSLCEERQRHDVRAVLRARRNEPAVPVLGKPGPRDDAPLPYRPVRRVRNTERRLGPLGHCELRQQLDDLKTDPLPTPPGLSTDRRGDP